MRFIALTLAAVLTIAGTHSVLAADPREITWVDLLPVNQTYQDPFEELEYSQISDLAKLYRLEVLNTDDVDDTKRAEASEIRERLVSQGLDPERLFKQREIVMNKRRAAKTEPNRDLIGQTVRLPGYLLPLEMVDQKAVEFLLVPTVGACIHTPPPPANQMVFVRYAEGFEVDELYKPVWISGEMRAQSLTQSLYLVDGQAEIETTYVVDALSVDIYD